MPESQDADALILAMAGGDEAAFAELWRILGGPVQRLAAGFLGSQADGDDIAQATFLKAWRSASAFDPAKGSGRAWIFSIARNSARDALRRQRLRWVVGLDALPGDAPDEIATAETRLADREALADLQKALLDLPDAQRMALLLASVADLETPAIARILGRSRGAVEQLIVRARRSLRVQMEKMGHA